MGLASKRDEKRDGIVTRRYLAIQIVTSVTRWLKG